MVDSTSLSFSCKGRRACLSLLIRDCEFKRNDFLRNSIFYFLFFHFVKEIVVIFKILYFDDCLLNETDLDGKKQIQGNANGKGKDKEREVSLSAAVIMCSLSAQIVPI